MALKVSYLSKLYRNTGSYGSPVWNEIPACKDIKYTYEDTQHEVTSKIGEGNKQFVATLRDLTVEFSMQYDPANDDYIALEDAAWNRTAIMFAVMDGPITTPGSRGIRITAGIFNFGNNAPMDGTLVVEGIQLKNHGDAANQPVRYTVPA